MQFESRTRRVFWTNVASGLVPDIIISASVGWATESGVLGAIFSFLGLQLLYVLLLLKTVGWAWLMFWLSGRKFQSAALLNMLRSSRIPEPRDFETSPGGYLDYIASEPTFPLETRLAAAENKGALNILPQVGRFNLSVQTAIAFEDAIQEYKRDFQRRY